MGCRLKGYVHAQGEQGFETVKSECMYFMDDPQWVYMRNVTYTNIQYMHFRVNQWKWSTDFVS